MKPVGWIALLLLTAAAAFGYVQHQKLKARIEPLQRAKDSLSNLAAVHADSGRVKDRRIADLLVFVDTLSERSRLADERADSTRRASAIAIRREERRAHSSEDTLRVVLRRLAPRYMPVLDALVGSWSAIVTSKDSELRVERFTKAVIREERDTLRVATVTLAGSRDDWKAAYTLERSARIKADSISKFWEREAQGDFVIFGLGLELTCGLQVGVYYGTKGGDLGVGAGCTLGK